MNININICKISHLPFDMLLFFYSKGLWYRARYTDTNPYAQLWYRFLWFSVIFIFWRQWANTWIKPVGNWYVLLCPIVILVSMLLQSSPCTVCERPNYNAKTEVLKIIGQLSYLCPCHRPRTIFNTWMDWVPYQIRLCHKSTGRFPTINRPHY